jgi:hypothetical protein
MPEKFWILDSNKIRSAIWDQGNKWRTADSDANFDTLVSFGGPANRLSDLRAVLTANKVPDIAWTIPDCLIQQRVLEMFREEGFTGFKTHPAVVRWEPKKLGTASDDASEISELPPYFELVVTGWGGVAREESGVSLIPGTNIWGGYPDWSQIVDCNSWDGSDFFIVWPFAFTRIVTDRVAKFIRKQKLTGAKLISLKDYTRMYRQMKLNQTMPMRLRNHFPEEKAKQIGEALGIY